MPFNGNAYAVPETQIGIAREITRGTAPANPTYGIPAKSPKYKPNLMLTPDQSLQGSQVETYAYIPGQRYDGHGWDAPIYLDSFPMFLSAEFGSPDNYTVGPTGTSISTAPTVGSTTLVVTASVPTGSWITFGLNTNGTVESHYVATGGSTTLTLASPVLFAQPVGTTVKCLNKHEFSLLNDGLGTLYTGSAGTTVSTLTTIAVSSTAGFQSAGTIVLQTSVGEAIFTYTGITGTSFTTCTFVSQTGGTGTTVSNALVNGIGSQPPSYTIWYFDGEEWRQMTGCQLDELTIKGNGTSLIEYTCSWMGNPATPNLVPPTISFTTQVAAGSPPIQTPAPWSFYTLLGAGGYPTAYVPTITDWTFNFKRGVKPIPALTGAQQYFSYFAGPIVTTGSLTFVEQPGSPQLNAYLQALQQSFDFSVFDQHFGAALNIHSSLGQYITGEVGGTDWVETPVTFGLLPTTTDALAGGVSPALITVANSIGNAVY